MPQVMGMDQKLGVCSQRMIQDLGCKSRPTTRKLLLPLHLVMPHFVTF